MLTEGEAQTPEQSERGYTIEPWTFETLPAGLEVRSSDQIGTRGVVTVVAKNVMYALGAWVTYAEASKQLQQRDEDAPGIWRTFGQRVYS